MASTRRHPWHPAINRRTPPFLPSPAWRGVTWVPTSASGGYHGTQRNPLTTRRFPAQNPCVRCITFSTPKACVRTTAWPRAMRPTSRPKGGPSADLRPPCDHRCFASRDCDSDPMPSHQRGRAGGSTPWPAGPAPKGREAGLRQPTGRAPRPRDSRCRHSARKINRLIRERHRQSPWRCRLSR